MDSSEDDAHPVTEPVAKGHKRTDTLADMVPLPPRSSTTTKKEPRVVRIPRKKYVERIVERVIEVPQIVEVKVPVEKVVRVNVEHIITKYEVKRREVEKIVKVRKEVLEIEEVVKKVPVRLMQEVVHVAETPNFVVPKEELQETREIS